MTAPRNSKKYESIQGGYTSSSAVLTPVYSQSGSVWTQDRQGMRPRRVFSQEIIDIQVALDNAIHEALKAKVRRPINCLREIHSR